MPSARRKLIDIDRRIERNRATADELDKRFHSLRLRPVKAEDRPRGHMIEMVPSSFESPDSGTVVRATYDEEKRMLSITFKRGSLTGDKLPVYDYTGVAPELWAEFFAAESKGTFFAERVRPLFLGRQRGAPK